MNMFEERIFDVEINYPFPEGYPIIKISKLSYEYHAESPFILLCYTKHDGIILCCNKDKIKENLFKQYHIFNQNNFVEFNGIITFINVDLPKIDTKFCTTSDLTQLVNKLFNERFVRK